MKKNKTILEIGKEAIRVEARALDRVAKNMGTEFTRAVELILKCKGRVVLTGMGKSAIIAQKISSSLNSTGTPSLYMHAGDAVHGDLGMIQKEDVVLALSKSGSTPEIKVLLPLFRENGNPLIAMVGEPNSPLAQQADIVLNTSVDAEICPNNLAPTTSTTAQLAMGDALTVALVESRHFTAQDFARYHPGGALGKRLYLKVKDLCAQNQKPEVGPKAGINEVLMEMTSKLLGVTAVTENGKLLGVITDGDLRRTLERTTALNGICAEDIMGKSPVTVEWDAMAVEALQIFKTRNISQLLVTQKGKYAGVVHFHDLIREGIL